MKFQNPSFKIFLNGRTHGQTHRRMDGQTRRKQYAHHFFKVGGAKKNDFFLIFAQNIDPGYTF